MSERYTPTHPDPKAVLRVPKDRRLDPPKLCTECEGRVMVTHHRDIYGGRSYGNWPWVYRCESCGARVGMHPGTPFPLGTLAGAELRRQRKECKLAFETLWKEGVMSRGEAYAWLSGEMGIDDAHFGDFDEDQCKEAEELCLARCVEAGVL